MKTVKFTENTTTGYEVEIGWSVFSGDTLLSEVSFSDNVTSIGASSFKDCTALNEINLPKKLKKLGGYAFSGTSITSITIPNTLERITSYNYSTDLRSPFCGASQLKEVVFQAGMETIPEYMLCMDSNDTCKVTRIIIPDSVTQIGRDAFTNCNQCTIYGYNGSYAQTYADENNIPFRIYTGEFEDVITTKITGTLSAVNLNDFTVTINGKLYEVMDDFDMSNATDILNNHTCKVVVATLENGKVTQMRDVTTLLEAYAQITANIKELTYQNESFNKDKYTVTVGLSTTVTAGYSDLDIKKAGNIDGLFVHFDSLKLLLLPSDGFYFSKTGIFNSKKVTELTQELNIDIAYGEYKTYTFDVYVDNKYVPNTVNTTVSTKMTIMSGNNSFSNEYFVSVGNIDLQNKNTSSKKTEKESTKEVNKAEKELEKLASKINFSYDDTLIRECFNNNPSDAVDRVNQCLSVWIAAIMANASIAQESKRTLDDILKKLGIDEKSIKENIMKNVFAKLGISLSSGADINFAGKKASTIIQMKHSSGKKIKIYFSLDMGNYSLNKKGTFGGFGTLSYYLVDEKGIKREPFAKNGIATYADFEAFADGVKSVAESSIKSLYSEVWGKDADKVVSGIIKEINGETTNRIVELLTSDAITKIISKKVGTFSANVFNILESPTNSYTKSISARCPVDVYLYDDSGKLCGEIVNNKVNKDYDDVFMYVVNDEKFIYLTDDSYTIKFVGNDIGKMNYEITEYINREYLRTIAYNDIPLEYDKTYYSSIPESVLLDSVVPSPISGDGEKITATKDDIQDYLKADIKVENVNLDKKNIVLNIGESTTLTVMFSPIDAVIRDITWSSSNEEVVEVNGSGVLYAKTDGEAVITVQIDGSNLSDSCKVTVGQKNASPIPNITDASTPTETPNVTLNPLDTPNPDITSSTNPTASPSVSSSPKPSGGSLGGNVSIGSGAISGGGVAAVYTATPIPSPSQTPVPVQTTAPVTTPTPVVTPTPTIIPTIEPEVLPKPSVMPSPSTSPDTETDNEDGSEKNIKKGLKFTNKKTKAVYKIISTRKNKSVQYVNSTKKNITNVTVPASVQFNGKTFKVVSIGKGAFKNNKKLKSVKIGKNVKTIGKKAFSGCTKLNNVKMGKNITSVEASAFNKCTSLIKITIPNKVKKIGKKAFYKCKNLQYIIVKTKKLKANNIGKDAFSSGYANPRVKSDKSVWKQYQNIFTLKGLSNKAVFIINPVKLMI